MATAAVDRFRDPLYTPAEAARYVGVPEGTLRTWARGLTVHHAGRRSTEMKPVLTTIKVPRRHSALPFVGLAEAYTLRALRNTGVPFQRIRPALAALEEELGLQHALASERLFTDGAEVLYDFSRSNDKQIANASRELVVVRNGQRVLTDVVSDYLKRVSYIDGYAQVLPLPGYGAANVVADAARGFGQPIFVNGAARVEDALSLFKAGEPLDVVADEFGVPEPELEEVLRVALRRVA